MPGDKKRFKVAHGWSETGLSASRLIRVRLAENNFFGVMSMKFRDDVFNQHSDNAQQITNRSKQFEARFAMVEVADSPSNFFQGMSGTQAPVAVAHGECCADFTQTGSMDDALVELQGASPAPGK